MIRVGGKLEPVSWSKALEVVANKFGEIQARARAKFGVIGSNHTTNEENFYLQKFARQGLGTNNIDHHRTGDVVTLIDALSRHQRASLATTQDLYERKAFLVIGADLAMEHPFLSFQIRASHRHHDGARLHHHRGEGSRRQLRGSKRFASPPAQEIEALEELRGALGAEPELVILFSDSVKGDAVRKLVEFGQSLGIPVKYCALVDYSNSRGAIDMGLVPELLPGYRALGNAAACRWRKCWLRRRSKRCGWSARIR